MRWALLFLFALTACATRSDTLRLEPGARLGPMVIADLPGKTYIQDFEVVHNDRVLRFSGLVEQEGSRVTLVGLTPVGNRGFSVDWNEGVLTYEHLPFYRLPMSPAALLTAWQLIFTDPEPLKKYLEQEEIDLRVDIVGRQLSRSGKNLGRVFRDSEKTMVFLNHRENIRVSVMTRAVETY